MNELEAGPSLQLANEKCRLRQQCIKEEKPSKQEMIDMPVLGLAGRHSRRLEKLTAKMFQNRYVQVISLDILRTP